MLTRPAGNVGLDRGKDGRPGPMIDFQQTRLLLFDLDGTLVDSVPDLAWSGNEMLRELGMPQHEPDAARAWVGNGVDRFVRRVLTGEMDGEPNPSLLQRGKEIFARVYAANLSRYSRVYPGVFEALEIVSETGLHMACVTNKPEPFTSQLIEAMGLGRFFELVVAGNTTARQKPDPMPLQYAADYFSLHNSACLMVGDSSNDVAAARAAGFAVVCVPYGYNHGKDIRDSDPDLVVDELTELAAYFN